jgi:hypothetical protein
MRSDGSRKTPARCLASNAAAIKQLTGPTAPRTRPWDAGWLCRHSWAVLPLSPGRLYEAALRPTGRPAGAKEPGGRPALGSTQGRAEVLPRRRAHGCFGRPDSSASFMRSYTRAVGVVTRCKRKLCRAWLPHVPKLGARPTALVGPAGGSLASRLDPEATHRHKRPPLSVGRLPFPRVWCTSRPPASRLSPRPARAHARPSQRRVPQTAWVVGGLNTRYASLSLPCAAQSPARDAPMARRPLTPACRWRTAAASTSCSAAGPARAGSARCGAAAASAVQPLPPAPSPAAASSAGRPAPLAASSAGRGLEAGGRAGRGPLTGGRTVVRGRDPPGVCED